MGNRIKDVELAELRNKLGKDGYADLFRKTWMCCNYTKKHKRASGKVYENDEKRMAEIKAKYKNGVTKEIINEWINNL